MLYARINLLHIAYVIIMHIIVSRHAAVLFDCLVPLQFRTTMLPSSWYE